jgi:hypothetical protein
MWNDAKKRRRGRVKICSECFLGLVMLYTEKTETGFAISFEVIGRILMMSGVEEGIPIPRFCSSGEGSVPGCFSSDTVRIWGFGPPGCSSRHGNQAPLVLA